MTHRLFSEYWWSFLVRGIIAILFGVTAILLPEAMLTTLILFFGAYVMVDGFFAVISAFIVRRDNPQWWVFLAEGVLGILLGGMAFFMPGLTQIALMLYIGLWAVAAGVLRLVLGIRMRHVLRDTSGMVYSSIAYIVFGLLLLLAPVVSSLALMWCLGVWSIVAGASLIYFAFKVK